jgi:tetratricopeptide (TPR) repeat protein
MTAGAPRDSAGGDRLGVVLGLLRADAPGTIMGAPEDWPRWAVLLPHVVAAADHFASHPGQQQDTGTDDAAWLLDRAATYLQVHARLAQARSLAERALAIDEAALGPDHPTVATRLNNLALILKGLGDPAQARPLAERARAVIEAALGPDHPTVAILLSNLAAILRDLGEPAQARRTTERAASIHEAAARVTDSGLAGPAAGEDRGVGQPRGRSEGDAVDGT